MIVSIPKPVTYKNEDYLEFIRGESCVICNRPAEPHHIRRHRWGAGTSKKTHDYVSLPLCREHHDPSVESDSPYIEREIIEYLMKYIESKRRKHGKRIK